MKLQVVLLPGEDGWIVAECPAIPGCFSQGHTVDEALANVTEAIEGCIAVRKEMGLPLIMQTEEVEVAL